MFVLSIVVVIYVRLSADSKYDCASKSGGGGGGALTFVCEET